MTHLLNTLYVTAPGAYVRLENDTACVEREDAPPLRVPLHHLGAIVTFGEAMLSPILLHHCADQGITVTLLDRHGRFKARLEGPVSGNILLRQAQYALPDAKAGETVRHIVAAKLRNSRQVLLRAAREAKDPEDSAVLSLASDRLARTLKGLPLSADLNVLRGHEGDAAREYFACFSRLIRGDLRQDFALNGRNRRPPLDRTNALLSFLYTLLTHDCRSALEGVGLDPQFGYLHTLRPGRPALALDLVEEFRAYLCDRLALTLINRGQIGASDFTLRPGGSVWLHDEARKTLLVAWQERKKEEIRHPLLERSVPIGLLPHVQARLLARMIRGDMEHYVPFIVR